VYMKELEDHYYTLGVIAVSFKTLVLLYTDIIHVLIIFLNVSCGKFSGANSFSSCITCALRTWSKALAVCVTARGSIMNHRSLINEPLKTKGV
jgi:hypothetical protein